MSAPVRQGDFVGELCVALAHRWEPGRLFVIFTAYFDEADTHGPSPTVILAAYLGHAYQWRRFEKRLADLQKRHGFKVFHAKDFKAKRREFAGWSDDQCRALIRDLMVLTRDNLSLGLTVFLERERYENEYRAPPIPRKMNLDSQLGVCFRGCLGYIMDFMAIRGNRDRLHIVMESGHPNVSNCESIFRDLKRRLDKTGVHVFGDFTIATKSDSDPLMVADMLAGAHSIVRASVKKGTLAPDAHKADPAKTKGALAFLELKPDALRELKAGFEEMRRLEIAEWRAVKNARTVALTAQPL